MMPPSFTLSEQYELGGSYSWRLKDGEIRFRGTRQFQQLVLQRIPAAEEQIAGFLDALDLLQVWDWRPRYESEDAGSQTMDGSSWTFAAEMNGREIRCGGSGGYPSFSDSNRTTIDRGRFSLLVAAMYDAFWIEPYIHKARLHKAKQCGEQ